MSTESDVKVPMGEEDKRPAKRVRKRHRASCQPCQHRKTKCDHEDPCAACLKRSTNCTWDVPVIVAPIRDDFATELAGLQRRMRRMEERFGAEQEALLKRLATSLDQDPAAVASGSNSRALPSLGSSPMSYSLPTFISADNLSNSTPQPSFTIEGPNLMMMDNETEDAVRTLEDLALGGIQYSVTGMFAPDASKATPPTVGAGHPGRFTTICLPGTSQSSSSDRDSFNQAFGERNPLLAKAPSQPLSEALVANFFQDANYLYNILHRGVFTAECEELQVCISENRTMNIDPAWISTYFMVLAWSAVSLDPNDPLLAAVPNCPSPTAIRKLGVAYLAAADDALVAAQWFRFPKARAVQGLLLRASYSQPTSLADSDGSFLIWLSGAVRICQLLGLHRLGSDPSVMPQNDPAWPSTPCSLRRDLAKRLWRLCVAFDWLFCPGINQIPAGSFTTDGPLYANDDDFSWNLVATPQPPHVLADSLFATTIYSLAKYQRESVELGPITSGEHLRRMIALSAQLQDAMARVEVTVEGTNLHRKSYHRRIALAVLENRIMRLHRPFFLLAHLDSQYEFSAHKCYESAVKVCNLIKDYDSGFLDHIWFLWTFGLGAVIVVFLRLCRDRQRGASSVDLKPNQDLIASMVVFFRRGAAESVSPYIQTLSRQALAAAEQLVLAFDSPINENSVNDTIRSIAATLHPSAVISTVATTEAEAQPFFSWSSVFGMTGPTNQVPLDLGPSFSFPPSRADLGLENDQVFDASMTDWDSLFGQSIMTGL